MAIAVSVLSVLEDSSLYNRYTKRIIQTEDVYRLGDFGITVGIDLLKNKKNNKYDYLNENWAKRYEFNLDDGKISILIIDQERFLNPNFLVNDRDKIDKKYLNIFQNLFENLDINTQLLYNIIDWIDKNRITNGGTELYDKYPAKNDKLESLEEIKLIEGFSSKLLNKKGERIEGIPPLKNLITVHSNGKVNINTASKWVLISLDNRIKGYIADRIIKMRQEKPFTSVDELIKVEGINANILDNLKGIIDVRSQYFLIKIFIIKGDTRYKIDALIKREKNKFKLIMQKIY